MSWLEFALAFAAFFVTHSVPLRPPLRPRLRARLGSRGFTAAYSTLSLAVLAWLIAAAGRAPYVPLWDWAPWQNHVVLTVMLAVCLILALGVGRPNPFSFGGARNDRFDPLQPGVVGWMRHPLLVALALWAGAHLLANGDLAHVILFATFAAFALAGQRMVDRRRRREMGQRWEALRSAMAGRPRRARVTAGTLARLGAGLVLYAGLIVLHPLVFGVSPLP